MKLTGVILYGAGSPYLADIEEICARLGVAIDCYVANVPGEVFASDPARVMRPDKLTVEQRALPVVIPLISPAFRQQVSLELDREGMILRPSLIDPTAVVAVSAEIQEGVTINAAAVIGGRAVLERFALINRSASLGHHTTVKAFATIGPGAVLAGSVTVGRGAFVGAGAVLLPKVHIGANAVVGAGAVVTRDVPANTTVAGNPARVMKQDIAGYGGAGVA